MAIQPLTFPPHCPSDTSPDERFFQCWPVFPEWTAVRKVGLNAESHGCINSDFRSSIDARLVKIVTVLTKDSVLSVLTMPKDCLESCAELWWSGNWWGGSDYRSMDMNCKHWFHFNGKRYLHFVYLESFQNIISNWKLIVWSSQQLESWDFWSQLSDQAGRRQGHVHQVDQVGPWACGWPRWLTVSSFDWEAVSVASSRHVSHTAWVPCFRLYTVNWWGWSSWDDWTCCNDELWFSA